MPEGLELDIRTGPDGRQTLYFPFMTISDVHWGTRQSRAKRLSHMLEHTAADELFLIGDIVDGEYMLMKKRWKFGPEDPQANWHREGLSHVLRKAGAGTRVTYIPGNHDEKIRNKKTVYRGPHHRFDSTGKELHPGETYAHHNLCGKSIYGINFAEKVYYTDPGGLRLLLIHGDQYDDVVFGRSRGFWYWIGDILHEGLNFIDLCFQKIPRLGEFSPAAVMKRAAKAVIYERLGVRKEIVKAVDADRRADALIYGHSHRGGIDKTPDGKPLFNDGCCTEDVQSLVRDKNGVYGLIEWHKDYVKVVAEYDPRTREIRRPNRIVSWGAPGL